MEALVKKAFEYRAFMLVLLTVIVGVSLIFVSRMPSSLVPEIMLPKILVTVEYKDSNIKDVDVLVAQPLERAVMRAPGVRYVRAVVWENSVRLTATFEADVNVNQAHHDTQRQVDGALHTLPADCPRPAVEINPSNYQSICEISVHGPVSRHLLLKAARGLQKELERIRGVFSVDMWGFKHERAIIELDPLRMMRMGLAPANVFNYLRYNDTQFQEAELPHKTSSMILHPVGRISTPEDVLKMPLKKDGNKVVHVSDCSTLHMGSSPSKRAQFRCKGHDSVVLVVRKRFGVDALRMLRQVQWAVDDVNDEERCVPVTAEIVREVGTPIKNRMESLYNTLALAVILVIALVSLSLQPRSVLLVGLTIPTTFVIALAILYAMGFTLNMVVVFGLIAAVGVLVDGAIIVNEHADALRSSGKTTPLAAYKAAAQRMIWPAFTSVLTIALSFFPLLFWPGVMGRTMVFLPMTEIVTLGVSIVVALVFMPVLGATLPEFSVKRTRSLWTFVGVMRLYHGWLLKSLEHRKKTLWIIIGSGLGVVLLFHTFNRGFEFFPDIEPSHASFGVYSSDPISFDKAQERVDAIEAIVAKHPAVKGVKSFVGLDPDNQSSIGHIGCSFINWQERESSTSIAYAIAKNFPKDHGQRYSLYLFRDAPNQEWNIEIVVTGDTCEKCQDFARRLSVYLGTLDGIDSMTNDLPPAHFHWELTLNRDNMFLYGVHASELRSYLGLLSSGMVLTKYVPEDLDMTCDVVVQFPEEYRNWEYLKNFLVQTPKGLSPLSLFVTAKPAVNHKVFRRYQGAYSYSIYANLKKGVFLPEIKGPTRKWIKENKPPGVQTEWEGSDAEAKETGTFLLGAFAAALLMIGLILLIQFNNFFQVGIVLTSVIFSTLGALLGHVVMGINFCVVMTGIGVVALAGIIVSNNVILLDTYNILLAEGKDHFTALIESSVSRLRPIFLTQITTILGLIPLMFGMDVQPLNLSVTVGAPSAAWWVHMSTSVVWGVSFATPFTLFATPLFVHLRHLRTMKKIKKSQ